MNKKSQQPDIQQTDIQRRDDRQFQADMKQLIHESENTRLAFMKKQRFRGFVSLTSIILSVLIGAGGFGWFLLVEADIVMASLCMVCAVILPIIINIWSDMPIKNYNIHYKDVFMPKMAEALGGFKFHPKRGISSKIISKTGVLPRHDIYEAEDCFIGKYNGVKVIFSEARLYNKNKNHPPVFDGIFVLLETHSKIINGHTIITADLDMVQQYADSRWNKLKTVSINSTIPDWNNFQVFSDTPENATSLICEKLQKELSEAAVTFDNSPMSTVLFREKFIFMAIPYEQDMFEASNIYIPIVTKQHTLTCKKEIEQILEIVDIFDLYRTEIQ